MWFDHQVDHWEGSLDATRVVHIQAWVDMWRTTAPAPSVILKLPVIWSFALINLFDGGAPPQGNPNEFTPNCLPNLFQRTFGRRETGVAISPDVPNTTPFDDGVRVLQRGTALIAAGALDDTALAVHKASWRSRKGFTIRRDQALCIVMNGYNTWGGGVQVIGFRCFAHFGYRHYRKG